MTPCTKQYHAASSTLAQTRLHRIVSRKELRRMPYGRFTRKKPKESRKSYTRPNSSSSYRQYSTLLEENYSKKNQGICFSFRALLFGNQGKCKRSFKFYDIDEESIEHLNDSEFLEGLRSTSTSFRGLHEHEEGII